MAYRHSIARPSIPTGTGPVVRAISLLNMGSLHEGRTLLHE